MGVLCGRPVFHILDVDPGAVQCHRVVVVVALVARDSLRPAARVAENVDLEASDRHNLPVVPLDDVLRERHHPEPLPVYLRVP